jgi:5-carboxymethyl-2-hydroxymuconic-semialdehyde dehydrogenase
MTTASPAAGISPEFIDQIRSKLARTTVEHYINGQWTEGARGETFETLDPSTNRVLAHAWRGHAEDIDLAAKAAYAAFQR